MLRDWVFQQAETTLADAGNDGLEVLIDERGIEGHVARLRVGPADHLVLAVGVHVVEELAEAVEQVALRDEHEDGETHVERALDDIELLGDLACLAGNVGFGVLDEAVAGDDKQQAVDGTVGPVAFEEFEELGPFVGLAGSDLLEHEPARGVEQNGAVGEPPVHVDGAADALHFVLQAGWEADVAMADGLGLARAGFADDHVPGHRVHVLARGGELLHADLERALHGVELGAGVGIADGVGGRRAVLGDAAGELL